MIINSVTNPIIKEACTVLNKDKSTFVLDTPKLVMEAIKSGYVPLYLFIESGKQFLEITSIYNGAIEVSNNVLKKFCNVNTCAGVVAIFKQKEKPPQQPTSNFLCLDAVQDPGNVGALLRSALGFNFNTVFLIDSAKLHNEKVIRSSMGTFLNLNIYEFTKNDFVNFVKQNNLNLICADMNGKSLSTINGLNQVGLVVGNEGNGVSQDIKNLCNQTVKIEMYNNLESLNVAVAGGIIMHHIQSKGE